MVRLWSTLGAINALIAVAAGAFGAHGLRDRLTPRMLEVFETAARYQMYHALGLLAVAGLASWKGEGANAAGWAMLAGIVLFSGSLYVLALTGVHRLGIVTPFGGLCFMAAWALFAWTASRP